MLDVLRFVFSGFWVFFGTLLLIAVLGRAAAVVVAAGIGAARIQRLRIGLRRD